MGLKYLFKEAKYYKHMDGGIRRIGIKYLLAKTPMKKIVNTPIYNKIYSKVIAKKVGKVKPYMIHIENTNMCNAKCIMCPHTKMKRMKKIMSLADFKTIINNIVPHLPIKYVTITGFGEPLADRGIIEKIQWLNERYPKLKIVTYTNGSLLDEKMVEELLKLNIFKINFSINGTERNYKKIMGLDYKNTTKNILHFLKRKKKLKKKFPLTNISLMIINENKKEIDNFNKFWGDKADSVMTYIPSDWAGEVDSSMLMKVPFKKKRWPCMFHVWKFVSVDVDGNFILCCRDYESKLKLGNLLKDNIKKLLNSEKYLEIKKKHINLDFSIPICENCDNSFDSSLDWWS